MIAACSAFDVLFKVRYINVFITLLHHITFELTAYLKEQQPHALSVINDEGEDAQFSSAFRLLLRLR
jgi:hypothetical protein